MRVLCLILLVCPAWAKPTFDVDPITDGALLGTSAGFLLLSELILRTNELVPQPPGPRAHLVALDAWVAEGDYQRDFIDQEDLAWVTWISAGALMTWAATDSLVLRDNWGDRGTDLVLYAESAALALLLTQIAKAGFRRPRPYTYLDGAPVHTDTDSSLSFFSGHATLAFAFAGTASYLAFTRHESTGVRAAVVGGSVALAATTGVLRVTCRKHFPTDVLAGALVGSFVGLLVPHVHRTDGAARDTTQPALIQLGGAF